MAIEKQPMQISTELVNDVQGAIAKHDPRAADPSVTMQYLAATIGIILGNRPATEADKSEYLEQITGFIRHVMDDVDGQRTQD
jgi:hypothetical protein